MSPHIDGFRRGGNIKAHLLVNSRSIDLMLHNQISGHVHRFVTESYLYVVFVCAYAIFPLHDP